MLIYWSNANPFIPKCPVANFLKSLFIFLIHYLLVAFLSGDAKTETKIYNFLNIQKLYHIFLTFLA